MCGTYTRGRWPFTASDSLPAVVSLYRFAASDTPGMPGTVCTGPAADATRAAMATSRTKATFKYDSSRFVSMRELAADRVGGACNDQVDARLTELGARSRRITIHAVGDAGFRSVQTLHAHEPRIDRHRERCVGERRMGADLVVAVALSLQQG